MADRLRCKPDVRGGEEGQSAGHARVQPDRNGKDLAITGVEEPAPVSLPPQGSTAVGLHYNRIPCVHRLGQRAVVEILLHGGKGSGPAVVGRVDGTPLCRSHHGGTIELNPDGTGERHSSS
ncbi:hypothetical protein [Arthrobacter sp. D3-16]